MSPRKLEPPAQNERNGKGKVINQRKGGDKANFNGNKRKRKRRVGNKSKNMNYFNYGKPGHFARDCIEPKT